MSVLDWIGFVGFCLFSLFALLSMWGEEMLAKERKQRDEAWRLENERWERGHGVS